MSAAASTLRGSAPNERVSRAPGDLAAGAMIGGRYRLEGPLAMGGYGTVHRGRHLELNLPVAIKVLSTSVCDVKGKLRLEERFAREARTLARIHHRNVLAVHDSGFLPDGSPYLVSELIEGEDVEKRITRGPMSIAAVVDLGRQLFAGLTAIADAGVLHRDIKPANVMLHRESDGYVHVKLIDFGIALAPDESKLTVTGLIVGTPHYMSPEQLRGEPVDGRVDLYAASAVLYEALTSTPPFDGESTPIVIGKILGTPLAPILGARPDCPLELAVLVERGLSKTTSLRPASAAEFVHELDRIVEHAGLPTGAFAWADDERFSETKPVWLVNVRGLLDRDAAADRIPADRIPADRVTSDRPAAEPDAAATETATQTVAAPRHPARVWQMGLVALPLLAIAVAATSWARGSEAAAPIASPSAPAVALASLPALAETSAPLPSAVAPDVDALLHRGLEALARGEIEVALDAYRAACVAAPERPEAYRGRGLAAGSAGLDDEAISSLERYLALAPDAPDADRVRARLRALRTARGRHESRTSGR